MTASDSELLEQFARNRSEEAFTALVKRHIDLVYSAALRQVRSPDLAEEITQSVFVDLSRNVDKLRPDTILTAWLYCVTRRAAIDVIRSESRRQLREQMAVELADMKSPDAQWKEIEPLLDDAMAALDEADRTSILLRYFENKSLRDLGAALGISDDAAQKRVSRAVERLREFFSKRGVAAGGSGLALMISANAVQAAPVGMTVAISSAVALAGTAAQTSTVLVTTKTLAVTTIQKAIIGGTLAIAVGTAIYETRQAAHWRAELRTLQQEHAQQTQQWQRDRADDTNRLALLSEENRQLKNNETELVKLRGEVGRLRAREAGPANVRPAAAPSAGVAPKALANELPKSSWMDAGFATPQAALQTRGWAVLNADRKRFTESVFITDGARKLMNGMLEQMIASSPEPEKARQQIQEHALSLEDGMLFPMIAENRDKNYTGYRILSEQSPSADETVLEVETQLASAPAKTETLKFRRFDNNWKVVVDEEFVRAQTAKQ